MKDIRETLQNKEREIQKLHREIEILSAALAILEGKEDVANSIWNSNSNRMPGNVETIPQPEPVADNRPKRAFP